MRNLKLDADTHKALKTQANADEVTVQNAAKLLLDRALAEINRGKWSLANMARRAERGAK